LVHIDPTNGLGSTNLSFAFDENPGATRVGTLTIAGQILTVTQAGSSYVPVGMVSLVSNSLNQPYGVAVDGAGNVYIADTGNNALKEWTPTSQTVTTLLASGLSAPTYLALNAAGDVYVSDTGDSAVQMWSPTHQTAVTVLSGIFSPAGLAIDGVGNLFLAGSLRGTINKLSAADGLVTTLVSSNLLYPVGLAVDPAGDLFIANTGDTTFFAPGSLVEWTPAVANGVVSPLTDGLNGPAGVAMDGAGNVYFATSGNGYVYQWNPVTKIVTPVVSGMGLNNPHGIAMDGAGNLYIADTGNNAIKELPHGFLDGSPRAESAAAGSDSLPPLLPLDLRAPLNLTSDQPWLTIDGVSNGVVNFSFTATTSNRTAHINLLGQDVTITQRSPFFIGTSNLLQGPNAGTNSIVLAVIPAGATWSAGTTASWLHLSLANQNGTNSANVVFTFDANSGPTRSATITLADQTLTLTQAGSDYVAANPLVSLATSGLANPGGVAVGPDGYVFIADSGHNALVGWSPTNNTLSVLLSSGLTNPAAVAVDGSGNVYIADADNNAVKMWSVADNVVTTLVSSGLARPAGVAVDDVGNVYIADTGNNAIKEWLAASRSVRTLVSSGLSAPSGVAVDRAGNLYIADTENDAIQKWTASGAMLAPLVSTGLASPSGVAVDGSGAVYIADTGHNAIKKWAPATAAVTTLMASGLRAPKAVAVDTSGNVFIADSGNNNVDELPYAFVPASARFETADSGTDTLNTVLPPATSLLAPFSASSDQSWLTPTTAINGNLTFSFEANLDSPRSGHLFVLGQPILVTQSGLTFAVGASSLLEGPAAGNDSVVLGLVPRSAIWTATTSADWLHLSQANQTGVGSTNIVFTYDANPGTARSGTLTVYGQTVTVSQPGSTYTAARPLTPLVASGLLQPGGVTADSAGNVYFSDTGHNAVKKWIAANNTVTTLISTGLLQPNGLAMDSAGNLYIADSGHNAIKRWVSTNSPVISLISTGLSHPTALSFDVAGNLYIADTFSRTIRKWTPTNSTLTSVVSFGLFSPYGVAVDAAANVYIADSGNNAIEKWTAANNTLTPLVSSGLANPKAVAVDGSGNVYIADAGHQAIKRWSPANNAVSSLVSTGLVSPASIALAGPGNLYISDSGNGRIEEVPSAFVDPTAKFEGRFAGTDSLPPVFPANANLLPPFAPASDQNWVAITGINNGAVAFSFAPNLGLPRTGHISLLGQTISVNQVGINPPALTDLEVLTNGAYQFSFTNIPGASFTVLSTTNLFLPLSNWTVLGALTNSQSGFYQFRSQPATSDSSRFFRVRSP
jgi:DNA-binding beta-propeller fold protein YncE